MKRLLSLLLILLLTACRSGPPAETTPPPPEPLESEPIEAVGGEDSRPLALADEETVVRIPETPDTASFFLTRWDGEQGLQAFCYSPQDRGDLAELLPEVRGCALLEDRTVSRDPWPVYTLKIGGVEEDFVASYCGGIWRDSQGNVLRAELDFDGLWERFGKEAEPAGGDGGFAFVSRRPVNRELALAGGNWDARFLHEAGIPEPDPLVSMELDSDGDGLRWTIANQSGHAIETGNDRSAMPQVRIADKWYDVPVLSGKHSVWTAEALSIRNGGSFDGRFWREPFGGLPDGTYRLVLDFSWWNEPRGDNPNGEKRNNGIAAAPFSIQKGKIVTEGLSGE